MVAHNDTQVVELLGRNRLIEELLVAGLEVSLPIRDRGVDVVAYADLGEQVETFRAYPIQLKAASKRCFVVDRKYAKFANLILTYVWNLEQPRDAVTYALTYPEAACVAENVGWTKTPSWKRGGYSTSNPSRKLVSLLEPYRMSSDRWWLKITSLSARPVARQPR
jgi:hypothetical protein